jgi:hypothetical protein
MGYDALTAVQDGNYTVTAGICRLTTGANTKDKHIKSQCRLYFPTYKASAKYESMFMSRPEVSLRYTDLFAHTVYAKAGEHVQSVLSTTMPRVKRLIIMVQLSAKDNGDMYLTGAVGAQVQNFNIVSTMESPFDTAPATTVPCMFENFQVRVDNNPIFSNPVSYTYEQYLLEQNGKFSINGNIISGLCGSRLSKKDFETNYGYYVVDLTGREEAYDNMQHSVSIHFKLVSQKDLILYTFVEFDKSIRVNVITGAVDA